MSSDFPNHRFDAVREVPSTTAGSSAMSSDVKIPDWAMEKADSVWADLANNVASGRDAETVLFARALIEAGARGAERMKERAAAECDAVANDDGDRAARGFLTTEEQARRGVGRALAATIRNLEAKDAG